jgi:phosphate butyryltransferase
MDMIKGFEALVEAALASARVSGPKRVVVCAAEDESSVLALESARKMGLANPVLVGEKAAILAMMSSSGIDPGPYAIHDVSGQEAKAAEAVRLVRAGEADVLMKGMIPTSTFLHPIFRHEGGLLTGGFISHVGVLEVAGMDRLILQTDGGLNIKPDIEMKKGLIMNAVFVARLLGVARPKVALLSATEKVHVKIPSTVEAQALTLWAKDNVDDADVYGPLALDIAVSLEAATSKGVSGPVAGRADILIGNDIEVSNVLYKALRYFAGAKGAGIVVGAACPVVLTSRSDPPEEKINSIALATLYAQHICT